MYTREQWARGVLSDIGNTSPGLEVVQWLVSWTRFETATGFDGATYNLLNTTEPNTPGVVSDFNTAGVKDYATFADGCQANAKVLQNGLYPNLLHGLRDNSVVTLVTNTSINKELSTWGTGAKQKDITAGLGEGMNDEFAGEVETIAPEPAIKDYTIEGGDMLGTIGVKFDVSVAQLMNWNGAELDAIAREHGFSSSVGGHWIWPGTVIRVG